MAVGTGIDTNPPLREVAKNLRAAGKEHARRLGQLNKTAGQLIADDAKSKAAGGGGQLANAVPGIKASATQRYVKIVVANTKTAPYAVGAVMGAHHGLERIVFRGGTGYRVAGWNQLPPWVGNQWVPGEAGGPRAVSPAIRENLETVLEMHGDLLEELWTDVFDEHLL